MDFVVSIILAVVVIIIALVLLVLILFGVLFPAGIVAGFALMLGMDPDLAMLVAICVSIWSAYGIFYGGPWNAYLRESRREEAADLKRAKPRF